jgi:hypothetical protein
VTVEEDAVEDLTHRIGGVGGAKDFEIFHEATLNPFLAREILKVEVAGADARTIAIRYLDGAGIVLADRCWACKRETKVSKNLPEVLDNFSCGTSGDNFCFGRREGSSFLDASFGINLRATETYHDAGYGAMFSNWKQSGIECIHIAYWLEDREVGGELFGNANFGVQRDNVATGKFWAFAACGTPINESSVGGRAEELHNMFGGKNTSVGRSLNLQRMQTAGAISKRPI